VNPWLLVLMIVAILYLATELAYRRWIRPDCGLSEAELDCKRCERPCVAPVGSQDGEGFHLGAELMPREEVARQLTAALEHRWDEDPEVRQRLGEFKAAPGEYRAIEQERPEAMEITSVRRRAPDAAQGSKTSPLPPLAPVRKSAGRWL